MKAAERIKRKLEIDAEKVRRKLVEFIRKEVEKAGAKGVVVGMSGGLDSSLVASLCAEALGSKRVLGVCMPEAGVTDPADVADAREVANRLGLDFRVVDITPALEGVRRNITGFRADARIAVANIKPRARMTILYYYANLLDYLVVGTGNRSELRAGYFTKFGDGGVDLLPLGRLYKTQVRKLGERYDIPKHIFEKVPSAGLWRGQTDEGELGLPYEKLDMIYAGLDLGLKPPEIAEAAGVKVEEVQRFIERERRMAHKLSPPPIPEL